MQFVLIMDCVIEHNAFYPQNGNSSLLLAALKGHDVVIQSLLQHRATVDLKENVSVTLILKRSKLININFSYILFCMKIFYIILFPSTVKPHPKDILVKRSFTI